MRQFCAQSGIAVFASDMRGWGLSDGDPLHIEDFYEIVGDVMGAKREHLERF